MLFLYGRQVLQKKIAQANNPVLEAIAKHIGDMRADDPLLGALLQACFDVRDLEARRKDLLTKVVSVPSDAETNDDFLRSRHRRSAREAMKLAYKAMPCWVLPESRISETLPPDLGFFDLVIIDEASQSDIWALPALPRGEKLLVVGDHKQVSPSAIGVPEEKIKELRDRFLTNQPFGSEMTPDKSIYDLARVVFAGSSVMLQEHFRCPGYHRITDSSGCWDLLRCGRFQLWRYGVVDGSTGKGCRIKSSQ
jgi:AAA domain